MLSRSLVALALLLATSSSALHDHFQLPKTRKTVNFGFDKPHARFVTVAKKSIPRNSFIATPPRDPFDVANDLIATLLPSSDEYSYRIRKDSYTDPNTGVTHIYAKQIYRGLDVVDGDVNVNVYNGQIISFGNEFYTPGKLQPRDQIPLVLPPSPEVPLEDPRGLLLSLMAFVTPSEELAESIANNIDEYTEKIKVASHDWFAEPDLKSHDNPATHYFGGVPDAVSDVKGRLVYAQTPSGLELAWKFEVRMEDNWYDAVVSAHQAGRILSVVDWASDSPMPIYIPADSLLPPLESELKKLFEPASKRALDATYLVYPWGTNDPTEGDRSSVPESKEADTVASPLGWHSIPLANVPSGMLKSGYFAPIPHPDKDIVDFTTTVGNNVFAQENWEGMNQFKSNYRPQDGGREFSYAYKPKDKDTSNGRMKEAKGHINATITQLFYTINKYHDLLYRYGFDEISGNFQQHNFGKGGREDDAVIANAQDGSGFNNANFLTPPDGENGRMRMYLWNTASPYRDGDFEAGIVIHEYSHGLSTRLTGGPMDSSCLGWGEAGGMGEGWGDFIATTVRSIETYSDYPIGAWAANKPGGIRNYPYSLDDKVNPETYKSLDGYFGVHPIGAVWAEMLWHVLNNLIKKHGFTKSLYPPVLNEDGSVPVDSDFYRPAIKPSGAPIPKHGNSLTLQLVLNGMKLQKCRPDFVDARDAIIQADEILTGGENFCEIWSGFASKGLGVDVDVIGKTPWGGGIRTNGFSVPTACKTSK